MFAVDVVMLAALCSAAPDEETSLEPQVRNAIRRGIPYIEERGLWWIEKKKCVSCHRVGTMVWSLAAAKRRGFAVNQRLDEWTKWAVEASLSVNDKGKITGLGNKEGVAQLLMARRLAPGTALAKSETRLAALLGKDQLPDGSWKTRRSVAIAEAAASGDARRLLDVARPVLGRLQLRQPEAAWPSASDRTCRAERRGQKHRMVCRSHASCAPSRRCARDVGAGRDASQPTTIRRRLGMDGWRKQRRLGDGDERLRTAPGRRAAG